MFNYDGVGNQSNLHPSFNLFSLKQTKKNHRKIGRGGVGGEVSLKVRYKHLQKVIEVNLWRQISFLFMEHHVAGTVHLTESCTTRWIHLNSRAAISLPSYQETVSHSQWLICPFKCCRIIWFLCLHGQNQSSSCTNVKGANYTGEWWKHWTPPSCLQNLGKGQKVF